MPNLLVPIIATTILVLAPSVASTRVALVRDGAPKGVILVAADAPDSVRFAAKELQSHIKKMSGALLPLQVEGKTSDKNLPVVVSLGTTAFAVRNHVTPDKLSPDGFRIREAGGAMIIVGKDHIGPPLGDRFGRLRWTYNNKLKINAHGQTGTQFGVYRFLRDQGIRWYMPGEMGLVIPERKDIVYDGKAVEDAPYYIYRTLHGFSFNEDPEAAVWYKRVGYGTVRYVNLNHSFTDWGQRFADTHPEYFAVIDGKPHLETVHNKKRVIINYTEPGVLDQVLADADTYFSKNPAEPLFGVMPNDSHSNHDKRPETLKYITQDKYSPGWLSDLVWGFVNKVAHEVHERHPGKEVGSIAYAYQFAAPTMIERFAPNVVVMHARRRNRFWDEEYKQHVWDNLKAYTKLGPSRQYVWEYYNLRSSRHKILEWVPFVMPRIIASDLNALKGLSSGEFIQAKQSWNSRKLIKPGYFHLNLYVTARALWNPDLDIEALLDEYNRLYYGPAAGPMTRFWNRLEEIWMSQSKSVVEMVKEIRRPDRYRESRLPRSYYWSDVYTAEVVDELFVYLNEAAVLAKDNPPYDQRVSFMRSQFTPMQEMARRYSQTNSPTSATRDQTLTLMPIDPPLFTKIDPVWYSP